MPSATKIRARIGQAPPRPHQARRESGYALLFTSFWCIVMASASVRAQDLPGCAEDSGPVQIEVLVPPFNKTTGNTCDGSFGVSTYGGAACQIPNVKYPGQELTYKIWLHEGNQGIHFFLDVQDDVQKPGDLVLALVKCRGDGNTCINSSPDFIGSHDEEILPASYPPGFYYLYVDSARTDSNSNHCGPYTLTVNGFNPTPDLVVGLDSSPVSPRDQDRDAAVAGERLIYTLSVTNLGLLEATGVKVTQCLPTRVTLLSKETDGSCSLTVDPRCQGQDFGSAIVCTLDNLPKLNGHASRQVTVLVDPQARGILKTKVIAEANEGDPTPKDNQLQPPDKGTETKVIAESDLSVSKTPSPSHDVVAGESLAYTIKVHNEGPSTATGVVVTDDLQGLLEDVDSISTPGCGRQGGTATCGISKILPHKDATLTITMTVKPSAAQGKVLVNTVTADATEPDPDGPSLKDSSISVVRHTDLEITKSAPSEVVAGNAEGLTYKFLVCNHGPSDSSDATITDDLSGFPTGVKLRAQNGCDEDQERKVTCSTGPIDFGDCKLLSFVVEVPSSLPAMTLSNKASIKAVVMDPNSMNDMSDTKKTTVTIQADLAISKTALNVSDLAETGSAVAGDNLVYALEVANKGPSDSLGGSINDKLTSDLTFVASPDDCMKELNKPVTCPVPALRAGESVTRRFVVKVDPSAKGTLLNEAYVQGIVPEHDTNEANNRASTSTDVVRKADLEVALSDSTDPLELKAGVPSVPLTYTLAVTNHGPSDADGFAVSITLPPGASLAVFDAMCRKEPDKEPDTPIVIRCDFMDGLPVGKTESRLIDVLLPSDRGTVSATAAVTPVECPVTDPVCDNNKDEETSTLANTTDSDIEVTKTAGAEAAVAGDLLRYTIKVANHGPSKATKVTVEDPLPGSVDFVPAANACPDDTACCAKETTEHLVTCDCGDLEKNTTKICSLAVRVKPASTDLSLRNSASLPESVADLIKDPNPANSDCSVVTANRPCSVETPVLHVAPLVLPFFEAYIQKNSSDPEIKTLLAVRNPSEDPLGVRLDYFPTGEPAHCEVQCLPMKNTLTRDLRKLFTDLGLQAGLKEGHVDITPVACGGTCNSSDPAPASPLSGDFIRIEPAKGHASSQLLVSTDPSQRPPELCRSWSVRFLNGASFGGSTEFLFFVPGNPGGSAPVAVGKVYTEAGQFVQEISVTASEEAFRRTTQDGFNGVPLLASFGVIEWEFPQGVVGNVSAIHRNQDRYTVAVPGFCRRLPSAEPLGPEPDLIVPYFTVDPNPSGATTLFAVHNESKEEVKIHYELVSTDGTVSHTVPPAGEPSLTLAAHATRTVNLRDVEALKELPQGYLRVKLDEQPERKAQILSGDFVRIDTAAGLASGGALVDTDLLHRSPPQLCRKWNVRFLQGGILDAKTDFVFYLQRNDGGTSSKTVTGMVYNEAGELLDNSPLRVSTIDSTLQVHGSEIGLSDANGTVEWELGEGLVGNVSSVLKAGSLSVLLPGVCIQ